MSVAIATAFLMAGCAGNYERGRPGSPAELSNADREAQALALAPSEASRERLLEAFANPDIPPLTTIPVPANAVTESSRAYVDDGDEAPNRPILTSSVIADVQLYNPAGLTAYDGSFTLEEVRDGVLVGRTSDGTHLEVHFATPDGRRLPLTPDIGGEVHLRTEDRVSEAGSLERLVELEDDRGLALFFLEEGASGPFARQFDEARLTVHQVADEWEGSYAMEIDYAEQSFLVRPGDRVELGRGLVLFAMNSAGPGMPRESLEGARFNVSFMIYRLVE